MAVTSLADWDGRLPVVLVLPSRSVDARRAALRGLVARVLGVAIDAVRIEHPPGLPPVIAAPLTDGLFLSSTSRDGFAAVAVARHPVGIDLECVDGAAEPPWRVLHPEEGAALRALPPSVRADAFARIWSGKEAYLKALGLGLAREPRSVRIATADDRFTATEDGQATTLEGCILAFEHEGGAYVLALAIRAPADSRWTIVSSDEQRHGADRPTGKQEVVA